MHPYRKQAERPLYPPEPWKDPDLATHGFTERTHREYHGSRIACAYCSGVFEWPQDFPVITYARCVGCTERLLRDARRGSLRWQMVGFLTIMLLIWVALLLSRHYTP